VVKRRAFTLIEVLVALVIFGVITVALSFTFDTALTTQEANTRRLEELGAVRSVFDYMGRDIQQAYASPNFTASSFIASGSQSGPQSASSGGLLTLMTRGNRLVSDAPTTAGTAPAGPAAATSTTDPQSETALVRYDFDPQARTLSRTVVPVPNLQQLQQAVPSGDTVISGLIDDISLRFWDTTALTWRSDWDYEQQNQQAAAATGAGGTTAGVSATSGGAGASASVSTPGSATSTTTGDTMLPSAVEVTVTIRHPDGTTATYVSTIPIVTFPLADGTAPPTNTTTATTTTGAAP
jgi:prepilin-type N-terminal cleavage/methylation domain-containing protein